MDGTLILSHSHLVHVWRTLLDATPVHSQVHGDEQHNEGERSDRWQNAAPASYNGVCNGDVQKICDSITTPGVIDILKFLRLPLQDWIWDVLIALRLFCIAVLLHFSTSAPRTIVAEGKEETDFFRNFWQKSEQFLNPEIFCRQPFKNEGKLAVLLLISRFSANFSLLFAVPRCQM